MRVSGGASGGCLLLVLATAARWAGEAQLGLFWASASVPLPLGPAAASGPPWEGDSPFLALPSPACGSWQRGEERPLLQTAVILGKGAGEGKSASSPILRLAKRLWERGGESPSYLPVGLEEAVLPVLRLRATQRSERQKLNRRSTSSFSKQSRALCFHGWAGQIQVAVYEIATLKLECETC